MSTYRVWFIKKCINMHYFLIIVGCEATHKKKKKKGQRFSLLISNFLDALYLK